MGSGDSRSTAKYVGVGALVLGACVALIYSISTFGSNADAGATVSNAPATKRTIVCENCKNSFEMTEAEYTKAISERADPQDKLLCPACGQKAAWRTMPAGNSNFAPTQAQMDQAISAHDPSLRKPDAEETAPADSGSEPRKVPAKQAPIFIPHKK